MSVESGDALSVSLPEFECIVVGCGDDAGAVVVKLRAVDPGLLCPLTCGDALAIIAIPYFECVVVGCGDDAGAVVVKLRAVDPVFYAR